MKPKLSLLISLASLLATSGLLATVSITNAQNPIEVFGRARQNALRITCQTHLRQLSEAVLAHARSNDGRLPNLSSPAALRKALGSRVKDGKIFRCSQGHLFQGNATLSGRKLSTLKNPEKIVLLYDPVNAHLGGRNVAWADGSVKWHTNENWGDILHRQKVR